MFTYAYTSSAILTAQYYFAYKEHFYGNLMSLGIMNYTYVFMQHA